MRRSCFLELIELFRSPRPETRMRETTTNFKYIYICFVIHRPLDFITPIFCDRESVRNIEKKDRGEGKS